uniref:TIGR04133 family radical SAM/SPASM protein n=1 Tax=Alistipes sp. TaxID=1872444 RepID=UPI004055B8A0
MGRSLGLRKRLALKLFTHLRDQQIAQHKLHTLFWECTLRCNLNCRHCGSDCRTEALQPDMPAEDFFRVLDTQITPHVDPHTVLVVLSGGEVLMRPDLEAIGLNLYRREYAWGMVSNGLALDERRFERLLQAGLHSLTISLDGFAEDHFYIRRHPESFGRALKAAERAAAEPSIAFDVVTCVTPQLLPRLAEFRDLLLAHAIRHWRLFTIFPVGRAAEDPNLQLSDEEFTRLMEFISAERKAKRINLSFACEGFLGGYEAEVRDKFYSCQAGVSVASIRVDGAISGCTSIRSNFHQGNIYKDDFWEVWQNRFQPFRDREWAKKGDCASCGLFSYCLGNGMHLYDDEGRLLLCHHKRLVR